MHALHDTVLLRSGAALPCMGYGTWQTPDGGPFLRAGRQARGKKAAAKPCPRVRLRIIIGLCGMRRRRRQHTNERGEATLDLL